MVNKLKRQLVRSPLHKTALKIEALWISSRWAKQSGRITGNKTIYCISPYKTGTTFLASSFDKSVARHEPFHFASVMKLQKDFEMYFVRRLNSLNLKFESSGFFSAHIEKLAQNKIAKDLTYVCVLRKPSAWVTSVVNHFEAVKDYGQNYIWYNEFYKQQAGVDLVTFFDNDKSTQLELAENLIEFYLSFTRKTRMLKNVHYVWINELHDFLPTLGLLINEEVRHGKARRNKTLLKKFNYTNPEIDERYEALVEELVA